jgi:hypothetical protein
VVEWLARVVVVAIFAAACGYLLQQLRLLALTDVARERAVIQEEHEALERAWLELHRHYPRLAESAAWPELEDGVRVSPDGRRQIRQTAHPPEVA